MLVKEIIETFPNPCDEPIEFTENEFLSNKFQKLKNKSNFNTTD